MPSSYLILYLYRSAETVGTLAESSQTVNETKDEFQGMGSIIGIIS